MIIRFFLLWFISSIAVNAQVSTTRFNDFKLGMKKSEVEKMIGKNVSLDLNGGYPIGSSQVEHKGIAYEISFSNVYDEQGKELNDFTVYSITSQDRRLKTLSGISIGSSYDEVLKTYKNYNISVNDFWNDDSTRDKTTRLFTISDYETGAQLIITLKNGKVFEFYVSFYEGC